MANSIITKTGYKIGVKGLTPEQISNVKYSAENVGNNGANAGIMAQNYAQQNSKSNAFMSAALPKTPGAMPQTGGFVSPQQQNNAFDANMPQANGLTAHEQERLQYLLKHRPNAPQVQQLQAKMKAAGQTGFNSLNPTGINDQTGQVNSGQFLNNTPQLPGMNDLMGEAQKARDAGYGYLTQDFATQKQQEMEASKQELAQRGIPLDPDPNSLYGRTMAQIDQKYRKLDDSAKQQSWALGNSLLGTEGNVGVNNYNAFVNAYLGAGQNNANSYYNQQRIDLAKKDPNLTGPIIGGNAPGFGV